MSEINVLKGRKFEDYLKEISTTIRDRHFNFTELREAILERLQQLQLGGVNPNNILALAGNVMEDGYDTSLSEEEACDLITRKLFNQSLFESTQADIEAEAELRDAENEYVRLAQAAQGAYSRFQELRAAYQGKVEEATQ